MQKIVFTLISSIIAIPFLAFAHGENGEATGKVIWENIRDKKTSCDQLKDSDFKTLGDYFMGQMSGDSHEAMDQMMDQMMGEDNTDLMHIVMGKRLSGCDSAADFPQAGRGFLPMMQMMSGIPAAGWQNMMGQGGFGMMGNLGGGGMGFWMVAGWIVLIAFWVLIFLGLAVLIKWLLNQIKK